MPSSGVIEQPFRTYYRLRIEWSQSKDIPNNRSTVTCNVYVVSTSSNWGIASGSVNTTYSIDGYNGSFTSASFNISGTSAKIGSFSRTVNHNNDGSKSVNISVSWAFNGSIGGVYIGTVTASGTAQLDPIARASQPRLSATTFNMGSSITIYTDRASTSFTHTIRYGFGNVGGTIASNVGDSTTWQVPLSLANQIPNAVEGWGRIHCDTYHNGKHIGTKSVTFYARVPSSVTPKLNDFYIAEYVDNVKNKIGAYVQNLSRLRIEIWSSHIETAYGSAIKSFKIEMDGKSWTGWAATTDPLTKSGNLTIKATITDGRGRSASHQKTVNILPYGEPVITVANVKRVDSNGQEDPLGNYARLSFSGKFSPLVVGSTQKNKVTWRIYSKPRGSSSWGNPKASGQITSGSTVSPAIPILSGYDVLSSYDFRFEIQDEFKTSIAYFVLPSGETVATFSRTGMGVGKVHEQGGLDVKGEIYQDGALVAPTGSITMFAGSTAPPGWLLCNGQAVSRTTYAKLFSVIGTTYGAGDGSTTFNLPDLRGRVPVGLNTSDSSFNTLNKKGGAKTHKLTGAEMPRHQHSVGNYNADGPEVDYTPYLPTLGGKTGYMTNIKTMYEGEDQPHNNLQPYITLNFIIKAV